jgi:hypothetical protein
MSSIKRESFEYHSALIEIVKRGMSYHVIAVRESKHSPTEIYTAESYASRREYAIELAMTRLDNMQIEHDKILLKIEPVPGSLIIDTYDYRGKDRPTRKTRTESVFANTLSHNIGDEPLTRAKMAQDGGEDYSPAYRAHLQRVNTVKCTPAYSHIMANIAQAKATFAALGR